jgi:hypothetical protein
VQGLRRVELEVEAASGMLKIIGVESFCCGLRWRRSNRGTDRSRSGFSSGLRTSSPILFDVGPRHVFLDAAHT